MAPGGLLDDYDVKEASAFQQVAAYFRQGYNLPGGMHFEQVVRDR